MIHYPGPSCRQGVAWPLPASSVWPGPYDVTSLNLSERSCSLLRCDDNGPPVSTFLQRTCSTTYSVLDISIPLYLYRSQSKKQSKVNTLRSMECLTTHTKLRLTSLPSQPLEGRPHHFRPDYGVIPFVHFPGGSKRI